MKLLLSKASFFSLFLFLLILLYLVESLINKALYHNSNKFGHYLNKCLLHIFFFIESNRRLKRCALSSVAWRERNLARLFAKRSHRRIKTENRILTMFWWNRKLPDRRSVPPRIFAAASSTWRPSLPPRLDNSDNSATGCTCKQQSIPLHILLHVYYIQQTLSYSIPF